jgi:type IV secretion system protein VirB6
MHIFISSAIAIIIYVFVSPIIIPLVLFEKTKSIFDAWLTHLISFTLSPIVLFAYLAIFISISEQVMFGKATIQEGKVECGKYCISKDGNVRPSSDSECKNREIKDPLDENAACILNFNDFSKNNSFALFGVGLPALGNLLEKGKVELRFMIILKTALFLYVLSQFMDEIPSVISRLTGETIDVKNAGGFAMLKKFTSMVRSAQKRGARLTKNISKSNLKSMQKDASKDNGEGGGEGGGGGQGASDTVE